MLSRRAQSVRKPAAMHSSNELHLFALASRATQSDPTQTQRAHTDSANHSNVHLWDPARTSQTALQAPQTASIFCSSPPAVTSARHRAARTASG
jgi:hypothetical protein